uniref:Secreted protein n=1 Tax=Panstrongylus lignarius TaxID=156445 RepID=A0A224Y1A8_9HEMI
MKLNLTLFLSANFSMSSVGSVPSERRQIIGTLFEENSIILSTLTKTGSINLSPNVVAIYFFDIEMVLSGHIDLINNNLSNTLDDKLKLGAETSSGVSDSNHSFHFKGIVLILFNKFLKA